MQTREILIANTKTQKRSKVTTDATTLGELKAALDAAGVDYSGMTFTEGISKTQLLDDATQLPQNVMYKGNPTNNLVILLTNTKKNIASGADSRKEAYEIIKEEGLAESIKEAFGTNYTHITTEDLWKFIEKNIDAGAPEIPEEEYTREILQNHGPYEPHGKAEDYDEEGYDAEGEDETSYTIADFLTDLRVVTLEESILQHIAILTNKRVLKAENLNTLIEDLKGLLNIMEDEDKVKSEPVSTSDGSINDEDIDDMINSV